MRNRESIATQTDNDTHSQALDRVDTETQADERPGGVRDEEVTLTERSNESIRKDNVDFKFPENEAEKPAFFNKK